MILIIDNYDSFVYNLAQAVGTKNAEFKVIRNDSISISEVLTLNPQGIILSPGPSHPENAGICIDLVKTFSGKIPILGVCLGHQAIAHAFGAKIAKAPTIHHAKTSMVFHHRQHLYNKLPLPFVAGRYHSLIVERLSLIDKLIIDAQTSEGIVMGIRHCEHPTFGIQFHPESILTPDGELIIENFLNICKNENRVYCS